MSNRNFAKIQLEVEFVGERYIGFVGMSIEHGGVSPSRGLGVGEFEAGQDVSDGGFVRSFDFEKRTEDGEFIEADEAHFEQPFAAFFFEGEPDLVAQGLEELMCPDLVTDLKLDFLSFFIGGVFGFWPFEAEDDFNGVAVFFPADSQTAVGKFQAAVRSVEEGIPLQDVPPLLCPQSFQLFGEVFEVIDFDFGFNFRRHDNFPTP